MVIVDKDAERFNSQDLMRMDEEKRTKVCSSHSNSERMMEFETIGGGKYRIQSAGKFLTLVDNPNGVGAYTLDFQEEIHQEGNAQLFRLIINPNGSVTIMSAKNSQ